MKKYFFSFSYFLFVSILKVENAFAYSFEGDSGIGETAHKTGHDVITTAGDPSSLIAMGINIFLGFLGIIFLILTIYAGFIWMTARGNSETVEKAKKTLSRSIIGLLVILAAFAITAFVMSVLQTTPETPTIITP